MKLCLLVLIFSACGGGLAEAPSPAQQETVTNESLEGATCIKVNTTEATIDACRAAVKAKYNAKQAVLADGGVK